MQLDELVFAVDSTQLEKANKLMQELGISIQALDKKVVDSAKKQAQAEALQAKAAKDSASARLANAKATEAEAKAADTAAKASERKAAAAEKATKTSEAQVEASSRAAKMLQKQVDVTEYLIDGYSRGEAKQLAQMKSYGALASEMQKFISLKELERKLVSDPFDKSASGMSNMLKQYRELTVAVKEFQSGNDLTKTQARDLAKDRERLVASMRAEGATIKEIQAALKLYGEEYNKVAEKVNTLAAAEVKSLNAKKEIASATRQVTQEDERMAASLAAVNANLNKGATDLLVKYESNLKKMGLAQDEVTKKLATYKGQLAQVQAQEEKRKADNLARSLSPQLTDIGVSLYSGQAPLTVLLQQGGQIADLFRLSGVEAQNFGKAMKDAFSSMIPVMGTVVRGMGQFATSLVVDLGKGFVKTTSDIIGLSAGVDYFKAKIMSGGIENAKYIKYLNLIGSTAGAVAGVGLTILGAAVVALGVGIVKAIKQSDDLAKAMFNTDAAFKATHSEVLNLSVAMAETTGKSAGKFAEILGQMAKQGGLAAEDIKVFGKVAVEQMTWLGMSAEDVVKQYSEMSKKPVESLQKLAESTGMVSVATLQYVRDLMKAGDEQKAQEVAIKSLAQVQGEQIEQMKDNLSGFAKAVKAIGSSLASFFNQVFDMMWKASDPTEKLKSNLEGMRAEFDKVSKMGDSQFQGNRAQYLKDLGNQIAASQTEYGLMVAKNAKMKEEREIRADLAKANSEAAEVTKEFGTAVEKARAKEVLATAQVTKATEAYNKAKAAGILSAKDDEVATANIAKLKLGESNARHKVAEAIEAENKKKNKKTPEQKQAIRDQEKLIDIQNKALGLNADYNNSVDSLNRLLARGAIDQNTYNEAMADLEAAQPRATEAQKQANKELKLRNSLLGQGEGLGKAYYDQMAEVLKIEDDMKAGKNKFTPEEIAAMKDALERTTPAFKKAQKGIEEYNKSMVALQAEQEKLILNSERLAQESVLSNMSPEAAKVARIELDAVNKSKEEQIRLDKEIETLRADKDTTDLQKELQVQEAIKNSILAQKNIITDKNQAYNDYLNNLMGSTSDVLGRLNELASASGNISFANAVNSVGGLLTTFDKINAKQEAFNKLREEAKGDSTKLAKINEKEAQSQLSNYADITKSAKGFFKEGSKGYKALNTAEKAFRIYEAAMAAKSAILRIAAESNVLAVKQAADKDSLASTVWAVTKTIALKMKEAAANALAAITNQGNGDPYTAFPRIAAMAAIMAGLGLVVAGAMSSGGRSTGGDGKMTYATGKGTVLGDSDAISESIANSLSILEDVDTLTMQYSYEMLKSLRKIEATMSGVTSIILRSSGIEETAKGITEGTQVSGIMGGIASVLSNIPLVGGLLGKLIGGLFGTKTTITGQGVYVNDANYDQIRNEDITAGYYTDVNKKKKFFGITTSNSNSTNYQQSAELSQQFAKILNGFVDTVKAAGGVLGVTTEDIDAKLADFVLKIGKIDLKDLKGDEIKEKLTSVFGAAGDDIARQALAGFERFQEAGEGYLETIVRVANTVETVRSSFDSMNRSMILSVDNAMQLADAFGGVEKYSEATTAYIEKYYSEAERNEILQRQLTAAFQRQNLVLPDSIESYRALVESIDLTTEDGQALYALLIQLAPAFAQVADASKEAAEAAAELAKEIADTRFELENRILRAQGKSQIALNREREREIQAMRDLDPALGDLLETVYKIEDAADSLDKYYSALQKAVAAEKEVLNARKETLNSSLTVLKTTFDLLTKSIATLYNQVQSTSQMSYISARSTITDLAARVRAGGSLKGVAGIDDAVNAVMSGLTSDNYSSRLDYDRERLTLAGDLSTLAQGTKKEMTTAELQLEALQKQLDALDDILEYWDMQVKIAKGTYEATLSVTAAIQGLQASLETIFSVDVETGSGGSVGKPTVGAGSVSGTPIKSGATGSGGYYREVVTGMGSTFVVDNSTELQNLNKDIDKWRGTGDVSGMLNDMKDKGYSMNDISAVMGWGYQDLIDAGNRLDIPKFEDGGSYMGGLAMVGEKGPELINFSRGGTVYNNGDTTSMIASSAQRVEILETAVAVMANKLDSIVSNTKRTADILRNVTPNGDSLSTSAA